MKSWKILYSKWNNDDCITPSYWVEPIIKYINRRVLTDDYSDMTVWHKAFINSRPIIVRCPFDKEDSNFVKILKREWFEVVYSHLDEWKDFYEYEPEERDIIISNPPFTGKRKIFERALSFWKPFALLMTNTRLNDAAPKQLFAKKDLQLLMFDKRIEYGQWNKITFSSSYFCYSFLPKQIIMEEITKS